MGSHRVLAAICAAVALHLIFKQLIVKPLVVYIHVRKIYKCYPVKHVIGFIVIAHFIIKQHITKLHNVYGYVHKFYENHIVKHIEQFVLRASKPYSKS
ncbi:hypothetical protein K4K49_003865 [Colletotrichum sp. SAR 10_70]|nr:hypothetical protein K4K49_003865 [Colletotrichum sp. SAR 10_70]